MSDIDIRRHKLYIFYGSLITFYSAYTSQVSSTTHCTSGLMIVFSFSGRASHRGEYAFHTGQLVPLVVSGFMGSSMFAYQQDLTHTRSRSRTAK